MNNKRNTATETYITYAPETDMTFIMKGVIDADTMEHISDECIGWSYGKITLGEALNMRHNLKAVYVDELTEKELAELDEMHDFLWKTVRNYVDKNVVEERQADVIDQLYDDDDFCNDLFRCKDGYDVEALLDNKLF